MKYAISHLRTEIPTYNEERYDTYEEAEEVYLEIPEEERIDFGIAQLHTPEEIAAMLEAIE